MTEYYAGSKNNYMYMMRMCNSRAFYMAGASACTVSHFRRILDIGIFKADCPGAFVSPGFFISFFMRKRA